MGGIEVITQLRQVKGARLTLSDSPHSTHIPSIESQISVSTQLQPANGLIAEDYIALFNELFWPFNEENGEWKQFKAWCSEHLRLGKVANLYDRRNRIDSTTTKTEIPRSQDILP